MSLCSSELCERFHNLRLDNRLAQVGGATCTVTVAFVCGFLKRIIAYSKIYPLADCAAERLGFRACHFGCNPRGGPSQAKLAVPFCKVAPLARRVAMAFLSNSYQAWQAALGRQRGVLRRHGECGDPANSPSPVL